MKKEAFDKIYRRFMNDKRSLEVRLEEKRRKALIQQEAEFQQMEKSRTKHGSRTRINNYIKKVQDDIQNRLHKQERNLQKKFIIEEREQRQWFKPQTNVSKYQTETKYRTNPSGYAIYDNDELVMFEHSKEFNQNDYDMFKISEDERFRDMEKDFMNLKQKKQNLEKATNDLLNPHLARSIPEDENIFKKSRALARDSEY